MTALTKQQDAFVETTIGDEIVLMTLDKGEFLSLDGPAADAWRLIDGARSEADIIAALQGEYTAEPDTIATDIGDFVTELRQIGVIAG